MVEKQAPRVKPVIFEYLDLYQYLKDIYSYRKKTEVSFSYEKWSAEMGLRSRSYLQALITRQKPFQEKLLPSFLKGLNLTRDEVAYLTLLTSFTLATDAEVKNSYGRQLVSYWRKHVDSLVIHEVEPFLQSQILPALFTYLSFADSPSKIDTIARDLQCADDQIQKGIRTLANLNLIDGVLLDSGEIVYRTKKSYFSVPSQEANAFLKSFHLNGIHQAEVATSLPSSERKFYSSFVALSEEQFREIQVLMQDFNEKILSYFDEKSVHQKKIYRINLQVIPVSACIQKQADAESSFDG